MGWQYHGLGDQQVRPKDEIMIVHGNLVGQRYIDHYLRTVAVKALLSNYNVLANVCRRMKYISSTLAYAEI